MSLYARVVDDNVVEYPLTMEVINSRNNPTEIYFLVIDTDNTVYDTNIYNVAEALHVRGNRVYRSFNVSRKTPIKINGISFTGEEDIEIPFSVSQNTPTTIDGSASPTVPENGINLFKETIAGRSFLSYLSDTNNRRVIQGSLFRNKVSVWSPPGNNTSVPGIFGMPTLTITGTAAARNVTAGSKKTMEKRLGFVTSTSANSVAGIRSPVTQYCLGSDSGIGGFLRASRFCISDNVLLPAARFFEGMRSTVVAPSNVSPATINNCIGIGHDADDTTLKIYHGGTTPQLPIELGTDFPVDNTTLYEFILYSPNDQHKVFYSVRNVTTNIEVHGVIDATIDGSLLPSESIMLSCINSYRANNTGNLAAAFDLSILYMETEY